VGLLWTPGYWDWHDGIYGWNAGYWGPHVGFCGGINYGFGYGGVGFGGGVWRGGVFSYYTTVNNFGGVHVTNMYNKTVISNTMNNNVSFNGGLAARQQRRLRRSWPRPRNRTWSRPRRRHSIRRWRAPTRV
jgi:hypothetical protein